MSRLPNNEFLSAYLDDELALEERADVERRLEVSADLRRELRELDRLSSLLRALPRQTAPDELGPSILRRAERNVLLGDDPVRPSRTAPAARAWFAIAASLMVTFAAMLATLQHMPPTATGPIALNGGNRALHVEELREGQETPPDGFATIAGPESLAMRENLARGLDANSRLAAEEPAVAAKPESVYVAGVATAADSRGGFGGGAFRRGAANEMRSTNGTPIPAGESLFAKSVSADDFTAEFDTDGDKVAVIEVRAADVTQAVDELQVALTNNAIVNFAPATTLTADDAAPLAEKETAERKKDVARGDMPAVYVESTGSQLAATINELGKNRRLVDVRWNGSADMKAIEVDEQATASTVERYAVKQLRRQTLAENVDNIRLQQLTNLAQQRKEVAKLHDLILKPRFADRPAVRSALDQPADGQKLASGRDVSRYESAVVAPKPAWAELGLEEQMRSWSFQMPLNVKRGPWLEAGANNRDRAERDAQKLPQPADKQNAGQVRAVFVFERP